MLSSGISKAVADFFHGLHETEIIPLLPVKVPIGGLYELFNIQSIEIQWHNKNFCQVMLLSWDGYWYEMTKKNFGLRVKCLGGMHFSTQSFQQQTLMPFSQPSRLQLLFL